MEPKETIFCKIRRKIKDGTLKEVLDDWKWIMHYSKKYKRAIIFYIILGMSGTTSGIIGAVASKYMIDIITGHDRSRLFLMASVMIAGSLISIILNGVVSRISVKLTISIDQDIEADIFDKIMDADWLSINKYSYGDMLNRFKNDTGIVSSNAISWLPTVIISTYTFIATFAVIFYYDKIMAFIALGSTPLFAVISKFVVKKQREYSKKVREIGSDTMSFEVETFYNYDSIKSFGIADYYSKKLREWQNKYKDVSLKHNLFTISTNIVLSVMGILIEIAAFGYCLFRLWSGSISFGTMTLFLQQRTRLSRAFDDVIKLVPNFLNTSVAAHRVRELVELPKETHISGGKEFDKFMKDGFSIVMDDLSFAYEKDKGVIENSRFKASSGEIVAVVGPSGEGKTTMIRLILGLMNPDKGEVYIDTPSGKQIKMNADTRHLFSYVPQGNAILAGTIAENMRLVKADATDEELIEALKIACAWDFVSELDNNIYYKVGESGRGLSEGQNQRIAIARAVLRGAPVLLLDEATSALDVQTERKVLRNIIKADPNKACIVSTHRPSVLNMCSKVYRVIDKNITVLSNEESEKMAKDF